MRFDADPSELQPGQMYAFDSQKFLGKPFRHYATNGSLRDMMQSVVKFDLTPTRPTPVRSQARTQDVGVGI